MTPDADIWRTAAGLIQEHGAEAERDPENAERHIVIRTGSGQSIARYLLPPCPWLGPTADRCDYEGRAFRETQTLK